jgi:hypothetical protein
MAAALGVLLLAAVLFVFFGLNTHPSALPPEQGELRQPPEWAKEEWMFTAESVDLTLSVLPLIRGRVVLPEAKPRPKAAPTADKKDQPKARPKEEPAAAPEVSNP